MILRNRFVNIGPPHGTAKAMLLLPYLRGQGSHTGKSPRLEMNPSKNIVQYSIYKLHRAAGVIFRVWHCKSWGERQIFKSLPELLPTQESFQNPF